MTETTGTIGAEAVQNALAHHGIKGMKWGVRKSRGKDGSSGPPQDVVIKSVPGQRVQTSGGKHLPPSDDAKRAAAYRQKAKSSTIDSLSNSEMQALIQRMRLEADFKKVMMEQAPQKGTGHDFVSKLLKKELEATIHGKKGPVRGFVEVASTMYSASKGGTPGYVGKRRTG